MMGANFEVDNGINENLNVDDLNYVYDVPEWYTLGMVDEVREAAAAEMMEEIFTPEVVENWDNMTPEEREVYLDEYSAALGEMLGTGPIDCVIDPEVDPGTYGYTNGQDGTLHLNPELVENPEHLALLLNTVTHEVRHCFQQEVIEHPENFPNIPPELISQWEYEFYNYTDGAYDPEAYANQYIEIDARSFAEGAVARFLTDVMP